MNTSDEKISRAFYIAPSWFSIDGRKAEIGKDYGWKNTNIDRKHEV